MVRGSLVVMRKYKPVELPLKEVPRQFVAEHAMCPNCRDRQAGVIGRLGLRLVFRCERCRVRFHRPTVSVQLL
jgi:tRNA(Ile2) C34 agmatinyltransferase TiaS